MNKQSIVSEHRNRSYPHGEMIACECCARTHRLLTPILNFLASDREFACVGEWKEGSMNYLVGKYLINNTTRDETYRCTVSPTFINQKSISRVIRLRFAVCSC